MAKLIKCPVCGSEISSSAKTCPQCGQKRKSGLFKTVLKTVAGIFLVLFLIGLLVEAPEDSGSTNTPAQAATTPEAGLTPTVTPPAPATDPRPAKQVQFLTALETARTAADAAANDMQKGAALAARTQAMCAMLPRNKTVSGWIGTIYSISANGDGKGVLVVEIGDNAWASTWNNAISDIGTNTLIEPNTALFNTVSVLSPGDTIKFSGEFFTDQELCLSTQNLMMNSKIQRPEFVFKFSQVALASN
ncbi:MAG TPA: hypothetical protein DIT67_01565 [Octadecabacter sp.]|mgnify:CR=1 FL=1|nr:hypothetical protein [Octadecabacter sp.]